MHGHILYHKFHELHLNLRMKYPLWFFVCYIHSITQQRNQEPLEKYVCIKVATMMKSADSAVIV